MVTSARPPRPRSGPSFADTGKAEQLAGSVTVYIACTGEFAQQPQVADGASQLLLDVLGTAGAHARSAIGVAALPLGSPVEVEAIAQVRPPVPRAPWRTPGNAG